MFETNTQVRSVKNDPNPCDIYQKLPNDIIYQKTSVYEPQKKTTLTFRCTGCLILILIMVMKQSPHNWIVFQLLVTPNYCFYQLLTSNLED